MGYRLWVIGIMAVIVCGCAYQVPLDDAYYWPDKKHVAKTSAKVQTPAQTPTNAAPAPTQETAAPAPANPQLEYISVKDTTITVRIKK